MSTETDRPEPLSEAEFARRLGAYFDREPDAVSGGSRLSDDLDFDSIEFYELLLLLEDLLQRQLDPGLIASFETVSQVYAFYTQDWSR